MTPNPKGVYSSRDAFEETPSFVEPLTRTVAQWVSYKLDGLQASLVQLRYPASRGPSTQPRAYSRWTLRRILSIPNALAVLWIFSIWWGERLVYTNSLESCGWERWEEWPSEARPHHLVFVADPQLVDPHTYPGRPWPLSSLTVYYTDLYLRRSFSLLQQIVHPDTIFFLGDLFDGGREWGTGRTRSPDDKYKSYGNNFWMKEYNRFGKIFFTHWNDGGSHANVGQQGRKLIANLPGNHDLGLGNLIQGPVRKRFSTYFGEGSRVDIVGNHTIVSVDTVSLTAMDQVDPATGSQGAGANEGDKEIADIWVPVELFLDELKDQKARAVQRELRSIYGQIENRLQEHHVFELNSASGNPSRSPSDLSELPTILLTHIPLYRKPGTPCGPLREHWPPSQPGKPTERDDRNAIPYSAGYQYQNVLTPIVSKDLISKTGNVVQVYSGDDHDYCEVDHREYSGRIKEITVKSISWAMGVRKPGFQMTSLWNPVDENGVPLSYPGRSSYSTIQNNLCLLPDQLGIFLRYAFLLAFTIITLFIRAILVVTSAAPSHPHGFHSEPLLPTSIPNFLNPNSSFPQSSAEQEKSKLKSFHLSSSRTPSSRYHRPSPHVPRRSPSPLGPTFHDSTSSTSSASDTRLAAHATNSTAASRSSPRAMSPNGSGYGYSVPLISQIPDHNEGNFRPARHAHVVAKEDDRGGADEWDDWGMPRTKSDNLPLRIIREWIGSSRRVGVVAGTWYLWILWHG